MTRPSGRWSEDRLGVPARSERAVHVGPPGPAAQVVDHLADEDRTMVRLSPAFIVDGNGDLQHGSRRLLDVEAGENGKVGVVECARFLRRSSKAVAVPDLEVIVRAHHEDVAVDGGALAQDGGEQDPVGSVDLRLVAVRSSRCA
jgi:hypothetical protein